MWIIISRLQLELRALNIFPNMGFYLLVYSYYFILLLVSLAQRTFHVRPDLGLEISGLGQLSAAYLPRKARPWPRDFRPWLHHWIVSTICGQWVHERWSWTWEKKMHKALIFGGAALWKRSNPCNCRNTDNKKMLMGSQCNFLSRSQLICGHIVSAELLCW